MAFEPGSTFNWGQSTVTVAQGETVTVTSTATYAHKLSYSVGDTSIATATPNSELISWTIQGISPGTTTVTIHGAEIDPGPLTITVTGADDHNFLNERGLMHFWENIDNVKQDKLKAGTNITISADNTISADLGTELSQYVTAEDIASTSALTPPVQTNMIADGAVTTGKIANKSVTSDKVNWTTFDKSEWPAFTTTTKNNNVNSDTWYDQYSYTIPADGAYIANFSQQMTSGGNSKDFQVNLILGTKSLITLASGGSS